jgi:ribosomal protein L29
MAIGTTPQELRALTEDELVDRLRAVRTDIARIYTIMRERELGITPVEPAEGAA